MARVTCPYCRGSKVLDSAIHGRVACRVCLGGGVDIYENDLGSEARPRELRRIAELVDLLGPDYHIFESTNDHGWSVQHPPACKTDLLGCAVQQACLELDEPPVAAGLYRVDVDGGELVFEAIA